MATILLVCQDSMRLFEIKEQFESQTGWNLVTAVCANEGRAAFQQHTIDLVILDLHSAGHAEVELFEWIRKDQSRVPVVVLTADDMDEPTRVKTLVMGAASYVPLSAIARDLRTTVERLLDLSGCRRRHARLMNSLIATEASYCIADNDLRMTPVLIRHILDTAEEFHVATTENRMQIGVAIEEAMTNGIVHGNLGISSALREGDGTAYHEAIDRRRLQEPYAMRRLFVDCEFETGFFRIAIRDEGDGFDPAAVADPTMMTNLHKPHGRGLFLMRAFMDEVAFNEVGNEIRLTKSMDDVTRSLAGC